MADKKPAGKKVFTATSTSEKQTNFKTRTGTADMRGKAKPAPTKVNKKGLPLASQLNEKMKKNDKPKTGAASKQSALGKRVGTVAREAKDVVKAVGTVAGVAKATLASRNVSPQAVKGAAKNVVKQVKETGRAAVTGKSGTTSATAGTAYKRNPKETSKNKGTVAPFVPANAYVKPGKKR